MILDSATQGLVITLVSIGATLFVALLAFIAQAIAKNGDLTIRLRRMAFISPYEVKIVLKASSTKKKGNEFSDIFLAARVNGVLVPVTGIAALPLTQSGSTQYLLHSKKGYGFRVSERHPFEAVIEFAIPEDNDLSRFEKAYLVATNEKGKKVAAEFALRSVQEQSIRFRKLPRK